MRNHLPEGSQAALSIFQGSLVVSVQADLYDDLLLRIREGILNRVYAKTVKGVVFDMTGVRVMDTYVFNHLMNTGRMANLLGVQAVFAAFQPGAVSALVDLDIDSTALRSFRTLEEALEHLSAAAQPFENDANDVEHDTLDPEDDG
ncbi:MAG: STAS domain-containing protein [Chloroflexota bacterium]